VLDWTRVHGLRTGENPARWKGHLDHLLPAGNKLRRVTHHRALPYTEVAAFMAQLERRKDLAALALRCLILTAARTSEVVGARWEEVDLQEKVWTVPPERMKGGREHRIPLSDPVVSIFSELREGQHGEFVFPGVKQGHSVSNMALLMLLRRLGRDDITVHGFRSTFRDWVAERTNFSREVAEMALAHALPNAVEAAYRRGDLSEAPNPDVSMGQLLLWRSGRPRGFNHQELL
jgi:integrase